MLSLWSLPRWQQQILTFSFEFTPIYVAVTLAGCKVTATNMDLFIRVYTYMCCCHLGRLQSDSNKYGPFYSSLHLLYVAVTLAGSKVTATNEDFFHSYQLLRNVENSIKYLPEINSFDSVPTKTNSCWWGSLLPVCAHLKCSLVPYWHPSGIFFGA